MDIIYIIIEPFPIDWTKAAFKTQPVDLLDWSHFYWQAIKLNKQVPVKKSFESKSSQGEMTVGNILVVKRIVNIYPQVSLKVFFYFVYFMFNFEVQFFNIKTSMGSSWHDGVSAEESYNDFGQFRVGFIPARHTKNTFNLVSI